MDITSISQAFAHPGADPRQWVSYGLVDADTAGQRSVQFNDENGNALPYPMVNVTLQPSGIPVACRVAGQTAGQGTGEWHPFVAGDEVVVLVPQGDERQGCVIIGRLNQGRDTFPTMVAGNDTTKNNVAFKRMVEPYLLESGTAILFRIAPTGAFFSLDQTGNITATSGDGHYLAIHHDVIGLQTADTSCIVQIDPSKQTVFLQAGATQLLLDSQGQSALLTPGTLNIITAGGGYAAGHAITLEQAVALFEGFMTAFGTILVAAGGAPLTGASLGALLNPGGVLAIVTAGLPIASSFALTTEPALITTALQAPADPSGTKPGVGRPGLLF
jgi:hypothetical protein